MTGFSPLQHEADALGAGLPPLMVSAERLAASISLGSHGRRKAGIGENFFPAQTPVPLQPFLGNAKRVTFGFTLRPSSRFRFDESLIYYRLGTRAGWTTPPFSPGQSIFNNYLNRSKLNYQFTKELSLRLILDCRPLAVRKAIAVSTSCMRPESCSSIF